MPAREPWFVAPERAAERIYLQRQVDSGHAMSELLAELDRLFNGEGDADACA